MNGQDAREVLRVEDLVKLFTVKGGSLGSSARKVQAVNGVSLSLMAGQTLGLVGETGCGKSTLGRVIVGLHAPTAGRLIFAGADVTDLSARNRRQMQQQVQIVFQDPYASLSPKMRVHDIIAEPLRIHHRYDPVRIDQLLDLVGLSAADGKRLPSEFSGGQRQRIGIARALALEPKALVLDEPVSALDVSIQAQILNLISDLQVELQFACLLISHDLAVVRYMSDRVAVMYLGKVVEIGDREQLFTNPAHPYTQALLSAVPRQSIEHLGAGGRIVLRGDLPDPSDPPSGCYFNTRCWRAQDVCSQISPPLVDIGGDGHSNACHFPGSDTSRA